MTIEAKRLLEVWKNDKSCDCDLSSFSWQILAFLSKKNLVDCYPESLCPFFFPSPKAAIHWIDDNRPEVLFYELVLTDFVPNCPFPYLLEK